MPSSVETTEKIQDDGGGSQPADSGASKSFMTCAEDDEEKPARGTAEMESSQEETEGREKPEKTSDKDDEEESRGRTREMESAKEETKERGILTDEQKKSLLQRFLAFLKERIAGSNEELGSVADKFGEGAWQTIAVSFVESQLMQSVMVLLLIVDVFLLFTQLLLAALYPPCSIIERDAISCCPKMPLDFYLGNTTRFLSVVPVTEHCEAPLVDTNYTAGCDESKNGSPDTAHNVLFGFSIAIVSIFMLELLVLLVALGVGFYLRNVLYLVDFVVVLVSLILESVFFAMGESALADYLGGLIFARVWRLIRVGYGLLTSTLELEEELEDEKQDNTEEYVKELERELMECGRELPKRKP